MFAGALFGTPAWWKHSPRSISELGILHNTVTDRIHCYCNLDCNLESRSGDPEVFKFSYRDVIGQR